MSSSSELVVRAMRGELDDPLITIDGLRNRINCASLTYAPLMPRLVAQWRSSWMATLAAMEVGLLETAALNLFKASLNVGLAVGLELCAEEITRGIAEIQSVCAELKEARAES